MSRPTTAPPGDAVRTVLGPDETFPEDLSGLETAALQVLHSRICRQLDREYLATAGGAHPLTLDRHHEVLTELDARETPAARHGGTP